jgi:hypothetical protein
MTEAQKILRRQEKELSKEIWAKGKEPYNVFLGDTLVKEVIESDSVLKGIYVDSKYCQFTERLKNVTRGVYFRKMGEAVKALKPEKKSLIRQYAKLSDFFSWEAVCPTDCLSVKAAMKLFGIKI